ncbi:hypothetical protein BOX15_Mlig001195g2, partial [Macrostomum lignano]
SDLEATARPSSKKQRLDAGPDGQEFPDSPLAAADCCPIEWLPTELLERVLTELDQTSLGRCAQVSRLWHQVVMQPLLWTKIHIDGSNWEVRSKNLVDEIVKLPQLLFASANLTCLSLDHVEVCLVKSLVTLAGRRCPNLRELRLIRCGMSLTTKSLNSLLAGCPSLSLLQIECKRLQYAVDLDCAPLLTKLVQRLSSLKVYIDKFGEEFDEYYLRPFFGHVAEFPQLASLSIQIIEFSAMLQLLARMPSLTQLELNSSLRLCGADLLLPRSLPPLRHLSICCELDKDAAGIQELLGGFPQLQSLQLELDSAGRSLPTSEVIGILRILPANLTDLRLRLYAYAELNDTEEADWAKLLPPRLWRLELEGHKIIQGTGLELMKSLACRSTLAELKIDFCTDDLLRALLSQLPRLRSLCITDCSRLTRQAWANLRDLQTSAAFQCDLHEFEAFGCDCSLCDEGVAALCTSPIARGLRRLCLQPDRCSRQLTAASLASIASGCPWLTQLALNAEFSDAELQAFCASYQHSVKVSRYMY